MMDRSTFTSLALLNVTFRRIDRVQMPLSWRDSLNQDPWRFDERMVERSRFFILLC